MNACPQPGLEEEAQRQLQPGAHVGSVSHPRENPAPGSALLGSEASSLQHGPDEAAQCKCGSSFPGPGLVGWLVCSFLLEAALLLASLLHGSCRPSPLVLCGHLPMASSCPENTLLTLELCLQILPLLFFKSLYAWGDMGFPSSLVVDFWGARQADSISEHFSSKHVMLWQRLTNSDENLSSQPAIPRKQDTEATLPNAVIFFIHFKSSH